MGFKRRSGITPQTVSLQPTGEFEGSDGQWSTFAVSVGSDNQPFRVLVSTSSPSTWIPREGSCSNGNPPSNCTGLRGIEANFGTKSQGYQLAPSKELDQGVYPLKVGNDDTKERYGPSFDMAARFANDSISLSSDTGNDVTLDSQVIAAFVTNKTLLGTLGLYWGHNTFGRVSVGSMFSTIPNSTTSFRPSLSYGYTAGAVYSPPKFLGSLVIGGYDSSRFDPSPYSYELDKTTKEMRLSVQSIKAVYKSGSDALDLSRESYELERHTVLLDSTLPYMFLPRSICDRFEEVLGLTYDNRTGLYLMDEANRSKHRDLNTTIQFNLADAYSSASITRISLPFVALDLEASWPTVPNGNHTRFFPIRRGVASDKYILGRAFMQEAYIIVDYERGNFSVAQSRNFGPAPSPNIIAITSPHTKEKEGGLGAGALAGIGIGATVVVIAMCALAWYLFKGRQKKTPKIELDGTAVEPEKPPADRDQDRRHTVFSIASSELPGSPVPRISMPGIARLMSGRRTSELATPVNLEGYFAPRLRKTDSAESNELNTPPELEPIRQQQRNTYIRNSTGGYSPPSPIAELPGNTWVGSGVPASTSRTPPQSPPESLSDSSATIQNSLRQPSSSSEQKSKEESPEPSQGSVTDGYPWIVTSQNR